jgi:dihydropyrimidine dehydrogenase (NAD+) subunit PreA
MTVDLSVSFTGIKFENPFLLSSAPPTESESNIMRAFDAGWGGVVVKTIGMHPVVNVAGPKTKFLRSNPATGTLSMNKGREGALHSSWNWELISDKPLDWWIPRLERIKKAYPTKVLIASIMAGSGSDKELDHWRDLTKACQDAGADGIEMNLSCPHMDRADMGSNIGKDQALCSFVTQVVKDVARVPVWAKLTPASADMTVEAGAVFRGGGRRRGLVEHLPVAAHHRRGDPRVRDERRRSGLERRDGRPCHPAHVARQHGEDDPGVSGQGLFRDRRGDRLPAGRELFPAWLRHGAGVHRGHAGQGHRPRT